VETLYAEKSGTCRELQNWILDIYCSHRLSTSMRCCNFYWSAIILRRRLSLSLKKMSCSFFRAWILAVV